MEKICILTGLPKGESPIKQMCYNCVDLQYNTETKEFTCKNEKVMNAGLEKMKDAAKNIGFDIDTLVLKPMNLKAPNKKCNNYKPNLELIQTVISEIFTVNEKTE